MLTEPASYIHARNNTRRKELTDKALTKLFCCAGWSVTIVVRISQNYSNEKSRSSLMSEVIRSKRIDSHGFGERM